MDRFTAMRVFARVARLQGFAPAARELRLSPTAVSRHVAQLEERLGVRLLYRTTRSVTPTEDGQAYLTRAEQLLHELDELEEVVSAGGAQPRGSIRISVGVSFAEEQLNGLMPGFLAAHPELNLELILSDRHLDLIAEGIDLAIRIGAMPDSALFARRFAPCRHVVCASPSYLEMYGPPAQPNDLRERECIIDTNQPRNWWFQGVAGVETIEVQGRYRANSAHAVRDMVSAGLGIAYMPTFVAGPCIRRGDLVPILTDYRALELTLHAAYPERRYLSAGLRAFLDLLSTQFGDNPAWDQFLADEPRV